MKKIILTLISALFVITVHAESKETEEAKIYSKAESIRFREGTNIFRGEGEFPAFKTIPEKFEGRRVSSNTFNPSGPLIFKVKKAGVVTLVAEIDDAKDLIKQGWIQVDKATFIKESGSVRELAILQKKLDVGEYSIPSGSRIGNRLLK